MTLTAGIKIFSAVWTVGYAEVFDDRHVGFTNTTQDSQVAKFICLPSLNGMILSFHVAFVSRIVSFTTLEPNGHDI